MIASPRLRKTYNASVRVKLKADGVIAPADVRQHSPELGKLADECRCSFWKFCCEFWSEVPGAGEMVSNWHMEFLCSELQKIAQNLFQNKPREYDLVINVSPGTSKSSLVSILFPVWLWVNRPSIRVLSASHTDSLVLDLSTKAREVVESEKYKTLFPTIELSEVQNAKGYYRNTHGGDRYTCTVAGKSPMGFHAHVILCLPYESSIITDCGELPIGAIVENRLPVSVLAYDHKTGGDCWQSIQCYEKHQGRSLSRVVFADGSLLELTGDHSVYVIGRGYIQANDLRGGDRVIYVDSVQAMPEGSLPVSVALCQGEDRMDILLSHLSGVVHERRESSSLQSCEKELRGLSEDHGSQEGTRGRCQILQSRVPIYELSWGESSSDSEEIRETVWALQEDYSEPTEAADSQGNLLFSQVCESSSFRTDEGGREFQLSAWEGVPSVLDGVCQSSEGNSEEGEVLLPSVRRGSEDTGFQIKHPSRRLRQEQQSARESSSSLSILSRSDARQDSWAFALGEKTVSHVERQVRLPDAVYNIRVSECHNYFAEGILVHNCDDPIDPKKVLSESEMKTARDFVTNVLPTRKVDKAIAVTILVMQRLGLGDPTDVMLDEAKKEGMAPVKHICLPSELTDDVKPEECRAKYEDGLFDSKRLGHSVIRENKARGANYYTTQFLQKPFSSEGGMFHLEWFSKRSWVRAAPYEAKRIRFIDRAATANGGCYTAAVLMADDGTDFYVEHVLHGQWEPDERNRRLIAQARMDRLRYGPQHEPIYYVEAERGSTGEEAYRNFVRQLTTALPGFRVREDMPSGSKDTRAEPWADQLAAGTVVMVDDKTWDIQGYIKEHMAFKPDPASKRLGSFKDQVDASAGCCNLLLKMRPTSAPLMRVLRPRMEKGKLRLLVLTRDQLANTIIDERVILINFADLPPVGDTVLPKHGLDNLLDSVTIQFADIAPAEKQETWQEKVQPYDQLPADLVMRPEHGKKLWSLITRKREPRETAIVLVDDGRRAYSAALSIADVMRLPKSTIIGVDSESLPEDTAINSHVVAMVKTTRGLVI